MNIRKLLELQAVVGNKLPKDILSNSDLFNGYAPDCYENHWYYSESKDMLINLLDMDLYELISAFLYLQENRNKISEKEILARKTALKEVKDLLEQWERVK
jgi:hypothetical protein